MTKNEKQRENDLISRCIGGDTKSEYLLYKLYAQPLYNMIIRMSKNKMETEDILQTTFIKIFKSLQSYKPEHSFEGWIKRIALNTAISHFRKKKYHVLDFESVESQTMHSVPNENFDLNRHIHQAIKTLPLGSRMVFSLYAIEGFSHKEIAEQLTISESTSKTQYRRAKSLLRQRLNPIIHE